MDAEPQTVNLTVEGEAGSATIDVHHLGGNRYQIVDPLIAMLSETVAYRDIVVAELDSDDRLVVR